MVLGYAVVVSIILGVFIPFISEAARSVNYEKLLFTLIFYFFSWLFVRFSRARGDSYLSPIILMTFAWVFVITLHNLQLSPAYLEELTSSTWVVIILSYVLFCTARFLIPVRGNLRTSEEIRKMLLSQLNSKVLITVVLIFFAVGWLAYSYTVMVRGGIATLPIYAGRDQKWTYLLPTIGQFILFIDIAACWSFLHFFVSKRKTRFWALIPGLFVALINFTLYSRSSMYVILLIALIIYFLISRKLTTISRRVFFQGLIAVAVILFSFQYVSSISGGIEHSERLVREGKTNTSVELTYPYLYLTTAVTNLQLNIERNSSLSYGLLSFGPVLSILNTDLEWNRPVISKWGGGIVPFQGKFYLDFGYPGIFIGSFLLGLLLAYLYDKSSHSPTTLSIILYAILAPAILTSPITNWFVLGRTWYYLILSLLFYMLLKLVQLATR